MKLTLGPSVGASWLLVWVDGHGVSVATRRRRFLWIPRGEHVLHSVRQRRSVGRFGTFDWGPVS